ncbi:MAG: DUF4325 domain-containing protein [Clostridium sp.]|nr:DUF4325 domain-containing protein [Clostridium sp.]
MSLTNKTRERIKWHILEQIYYNSPTIVPSTAQTYQISRTTVNRYLEKMEREGIIERREGYPCKWKLKDFDTRHFSYSPKLAKLEEDRIFEADIFPLLNHLPKNVVKIWYYVFCEIMNNAIEHSKSDSINVLVKTNILFTSIFISDNGVGIFENIRNYILDTTKTDISLDDAVSILFVGKLTTSEDNHSGEGIFFSSRSLDRFYIFSSNRMFIHEAYDRNISTDISGQEDSEPKKRMNGQKGTFVTMELWNNSKRQLQEVFDMFSSDEKGFYKTQVPIKSAIPSAFPVSRSQARRLCSGFDKFEEVELDFDGVDDAGRAFIHEIFNVFQAKHPEIHIKVKNANDNIVSVINRVKNTVG